MKWYFEIKRRDDFRLKKRINKYQRTIGVNDADLRVENNFMKETHTQNETITLKKKF